MGIEGTVYVQFVIEKDGSISNVQAVRGIGGGCDEVAVEVISNSEKWIAGKQAGQFVRSRRIIPIKFVLTEEGATANKKYDGLELTEKQKKLLIEYLRNLDRSTPISVDKEFDGANLSINITEDGSIKIKVIE
jgi:TonB family protein